MNKKAVAEKIAAINERIATAETSRDKSKSKYYKNDIDKYIKKLKKERATLTRVDGGNNGQDTRN